MTRETSGATGTSPAANEAACIAFLEDLESAGDEGVNAILRVHSERHPHLADKLRALANMRRMLDDAVSPGVANEQLPVRLGDFRILGKISEGGMGAIYEAIQEPLNRRVVVKTMRRRDWDLSPALRDRFLREQSILARLHHTHIVPIHHAGVENEVHFFVMPYIHGAALNDIVRAARSRASSPCSSGPRAQTPTLAELAKEVQSQRKGPLKPSTIAGVDAPDTPGASPGAKGVATEPVSRQPLTLSPAYFRSVARVMVAAAEAIQHAHEAEILHRDLKPSNLMVDSAEHCWVLDFGLARARIGDHPVAPEMVDVPGSGAAPQAVQDSAHPPVPPPLGGPDQPIVSDVMGTPGYMAPEQFHGKADRRTDVWGLGAILYELLTLRCPFPKGARGRDAEPVRPRVLVRNVPPELEAICLKAVQREPERRYASAREFAEDLRRWLLDEPVQAHPARPLRRLWLWSRRNKGWAVAAAVGCLATLALGAGGILLGGAIAAHAEARVRHANDLQAASEMRERTLDRDLLIQEIQRLRMTPHLQGWRASIEERISRASRMERDDGSLLPQAIAALPQVDAVDVESLHHAASALAFDPQGRRLFSCWTQDRAVRIWDRETHGPRTLAIHGDGPFAFRPDGTPLQVTHAEKGDQSLVLQDLDREAVLGRFTSPRKDLPRFSAFAIAQGASRIAAICRPPGKSTVDQADKDVESPALIAVWDATTGGLVHTFEAPSPATVLALSPDARWLAVGDAHGSVTVWELTSGTSYATLPATNQRIQCLTFGRDSRVSHRQASEAPPWQLAAGDSGGLVTILDLQGKRIRNVCRGSAYDIKAIDFSPDGTRLISAGRHFAKLWDVATGTVGTRHPGGEYHARRTVLPRWSPDCLRLPGYVRHPG